MELSARDSDRPGFRPLYQQVRDLLKARISTGAWRPAEVLPSEQALAAELGVSQGTVRKALDSLVADNLVERRQGRGTFVSQHTVESAQFRFFKLERDAGGRVLPLCPHSTIARRKARAEERDRLELPAKADIYVITRDRIADDAPVLHEEIIVSASLFPGLETRQPLPNTLYTLYQSDYGVSIIGASEAIKAAPASKTTAKALRIEPGAPVLLVERIARDLSERPVELRLTHYRTDRYRYAVDLT